MSVVALDCVCPELNNHDEPKQLNALRTALIQTKMAVGGQKAKMVLELYQVLRARNYMLKNAVGARGVWATMLANLDKYEFSDSIK